MIKESKINIKITNKTINFYNEKNYNCNIGDIILVSVKDLPKGSGQKITAVCDFCGKESMISFNKYNKNFDKYQIYTCHQCCYNKIKMTKKEKYDDENYNNVKIIWTKEKCAEEAMKYDNRRDFKIKSPYVYKISGKNKWLKDITSHMLEKVKPSCYWTKEKCLEEALKYKYRKNFQKNSSSAYVISYNNGWLYDICKHMIRLGNKSKRCIYAFEFDDKYIYVGLTYNIENRKEQHINNFRSSVRIVSYFIKQFHKMMGITPVAYRRKYQRAIPPEEIDWK